MTWFAIKGPDGEIIGHSVGHSGSTAWSKAHASGACPSIASIAQSHGYRCVEVELVEKGEDNAKG